MYGNLDGEALMDLMEKLAKEAILSRMAASAPPMPEWYARNGIKPELLKAPPLPERLRELYDIGFMKVLPWPDDATPEEIAEVQQFYALLHEIERSNQDARQIAQFENELKWRAEWALRLYKAINEARNG